MNRFALLTLIPVLALTGCRGAGGDLDADAQEDFAATFEDDIEDLATSVEDLATSAGALTEEGARETAEDCYATFGDCSVCYSIDGGYLTGLFSAVTTPTPCGATLTVRSASATYTVLESALDGTWAATSLAGDYAIAMTGTRSAELTTSTTRRGTSTIDSSWTLDAMSATTVDGTWVVAVAPRAQCSTEPCMSSSVHRMRSSARNRLPSFRVSVSAPRKRKYARSGLPRMAA